MAESNLSTDPTTLPDRLRAYGIAICHEAADELERLRETLTCPRLTPDAPTDQFAAVLKDWEKGRPVNTQDLVNALAWRLGNQRREISRLREQLNAEIKRQQDNCNV